MRAKKIIENFDLKAFQQGKRNFNKPIEEFEKLAQSRIEVCKSCEFFQDEPVDWLKVKDENLPEASGKYCDDCGCVLSYKLRQNIKPCDKWQ